MYIYHYSSTGGVYGAQPIREEYFVQYSTNEPIISSDIRSGSTDIFNPKTFRALALRQSEGLT